MRDRTIAATYADVLLTLAERARSVEGWGVMFGDVAAAVELDRRLASFLASPRVGAEAKIALLRRAFAARLPAPLLSFLELLVRHRRQTLLPAIAAEYGVRLDEIAGRVHADVTVARPISEKDQASLAVQLTRSFGDGRKVVPVVRVHPPILGGAIIRIGDRVADGSVRTRLARLRRQLVAAR